MLTIARLAEVTGQPSFKADLPGPLRPGDHLCLSFCLRRTSGGRQDLLEVRNEEFRVSASIQERDRQRIDIQAIRKDPTWKSVRVREPWKRVIPPARFPRQSVR